MPLPSGTRLGPYEVLGLIGAGGMGEVYKARDTRLDRTVAIKVLPGDIAGDPDLRTRFEREARAVAALEHPNICSIYDVGESHGTHFLVMPHLVGETLAARLQKGPLTLEQSLTIARQIADALHKAHLEGIVHRDLKPANIMLTASGARLLDFGLAKLQPPGIVTNNSNAATLATPPATAQGTVLGTLHYMSPEQLEGREATVQSDVWAFGAVLYEMMTGERAFDRSYGKALTVRPRRVARVIERCLERSPGARWRSMAEVAAALQARSPVSTHLTRALVLVGVLLLAGASFVALRTWRARLAPPPNPQTILVADFKNTTGEALFDGVLEGALAVALESSSFINVYGRREALNVAAQIGRFTALDDTAARLVARREGIPILVTGSVAPGQSGYDISAALIDSVSGSPLAMATEKNLDKSSVLSAVSRISGRLRQSAGDSVASSTNDLSREAFTTSSLDAAKAFATGQLLSSTGKDEEALAAYQEAVRIDPEFGRAYTGWALSADRLGRSQEAEKLFQKAIALLSRMNRRERLKTEGLYEFGLRQDFVRAREIYATLVAEYPADLGGLNNLAVCEFTLGRFDEAFEQGQRIVSMSPKYVLGRMNLALYAMYAGHFETAAEHAHVAIGLSTRAAGAYIPLAVAAAINGHYVEAQGWYKTMAAAGSKGSWLSELGLADLEIAQGRANDAERRLLRRIPEDERAQNTMGVATEYALLAEIAAQLRRPADVARYVGKGRLASSDPMLVYRFALTLIDAGRVDAARVFAGELARATQPSAAQYRRALLAELDAEAGGAAQILAVAREIGTWWAHYRAAVVLSRSNAPEAAEALRWCLDHRSQGVSAFLDDVPTMRYYVAVLSLKPRSVQ